MSNGQSNPSIWDAYERGESPGRSVTFEDNEHLGESPRAEGASDGLLNVRRRRSSVSNRISALGDVGGVNSIRSFARSFQRAAGFTEVIPQRPSFVFAPDQAPIGAHDGIPYGGRGEETGTSYSGGASAPRVSLLRQHLEASARSDEDGPRQGSPGPSGEAQPLLGGQQQYHPQQQQQQQQQHPSVLGRYPSSSTGSFRDREQKALDGELRRTFSVGSSRGTPTSIFAVPPQLAAPDIVGSYGSFRNYGAVSTEDDDGFGDSSSMSQAAELWRQQQMSGNMPDGETQPILVKEVEQDDGKIVLTVKGQSTLPQTIFNSINVLIGVGLLSLPMGFKYAGWLCGMLTLLGAALVTSYTAKLLAKCMDLDPSLITFSDLAYISFGRNARIATSILFTLELLAACVALIVLFADSMDLLFHGALSVNQWKVLFSVILIPLNFLPLRYLSFTSVIGIICCITIVLIVIIDGLVKPDSPGSLIHPATTYLFPANWLTLPLSFGLLMSPWGGHGVFPNIYRDMRHPHKYTRALKVTFSFTYLLDATAAIAGLLMFGDNVLDAITSNILLTAGYPQALTYLLCGVIAIIPLTKVPLNARPIVATAEVLLGVHQQAISEGSSAMVGRSAWFRGIMKIVIRVAIILVFLVISIVFPAFDSIMAFMGSALCFTICVTLPVAFHLKLFGREISAMERMANWALIIVCSLLSVTGTVFAFLPKDAIGAA